MEDSLLRPPPRKHASTPPPQRESGDGQMDGIRNGTTIRWDLRHPYDRLRTRDQSEDGRSSRDPSPFGSIAPRRQQQRPNLTIVTSAAGEHERLSGSRSRDYVVDVQSLASGSTTATNSGTPPSTLSKTDSIGKLKRPPLLRDTSSTLSSASSTDSPRRHRWLGWLLSSVRVRPDRPIPSSPSTPFALPRRLSRLPSFFTRERLYLPQHMQRRDVFLLTATILMALGFTALGAFAAARPQMVCDSKFLQNAVDALLPGLFIGAPSTMLVVAIAVSGWGKAWIKGRYTPLLYVLAATLGKVCVGALVANLDWTVLAC